MKVIVTGGDGFIGSHLVNELEQAAHEVVVIDRKRGQRHDMRFPENVDLMFDRHEEADVCVHLAAKVGRLFGEDNPAETIVDNTAMTALVAKACGDRSISLVYASTSEVYGDNGEQECDEHDGPFTLPHNLYGISKGWGEQACEHYAPDRLAILRFSMPYGPGLPAGRGRAAIINMLWQALHRRPIPVHRGAERSWCWIGDTVRAAKMIIENGDGGTFNVGRDDNPVTMERIAMIACELADADPALIETVDPPSNQTVVKRLATQRVRDLGWRPTVEIEEGMRRTLDWVRLLDSETGTPVGDKQETA